jgi:hypothetical protein
MDSSGSRDAVEKANRRQKMKLEEIIVFEMITIKFELKMN